MNMNRPKITVKKYLQYLRLLEEQLIESIKSRRQLIDFIKTTQSEWPEWPEWDFIYSYERKPGYLHPAYEIEVTPSDIYQALMDIRSDFEKIQNQIIGLENEMIETAKEISIIKTRASIGKRRKVRRITPPLCSHGHVMKTHKNSRSEESYWYCEQCVEGACLHCNTFHDDNEDPLSID